MSSSSTVPGPNIKASQHNYGTCDFPRMSGVVSSVLEEAGAGTIERGCRATPVSAGLNEEHTSRRRG
jgi:hypothetical protein